MQAIVDLTDRLTPTAQTDWPPGPVMKYAVPFLLLVSFLANFRCCFQEEGWENKYLLWKTICFFFFLEIILFAHTDISCQNHSWALTVSDKPKIAFFLPFFSLTQSVKICQHMLSLKVCPVFGIVLLWVWTEECLGFERHRTDAWNVVPYICISICWFQMWLSSQDEGCGLIGVTLNKDKARSSM